MKDGERGRGVLGMGLGGTARSKYSATQKNAAPVRDGD
ncbi:hypothetical protein BRAS3809_1810010 [Bradyrhizobium sp. STM 3809]|nr:hypothetical protein BRAS3809_1810010 [Bradyrhizobium sp. STM 3809]